MFRLFNAIHQERVQYAMGLKVGSIIGAASNIKMAISNFSSNALSSGVEDRTSSAMLGSLAADMDDIPTGFAEENDEFDLDRPSEGFSSIHEAIEDIRNGKVGFILQLMLYVYGGLKNGGSVV